MNFQNLKMRFLGLAAPGSNQISYGKDLVALWRTMNGQRFQNYESYFTVLDTGNESISKGWLRALVYDFENSLKLAPSCWKEYIDLGKNGLRPLRSPKVLSIPSKASQLPIDDDGRSVLDKIRNYYSSEPYRFEKCATRIVQMMDSNFYDFDLTRPWKDGGRDAIGRYHIGMPSRPLSIDCALEAKCYGESNSVGTKQMSRLIARIKYRQFGVLITTSYVDKQAYGEVLEDGHPILVLCAIDIAEILRRNGIGSNTIIAWLDAIESGV